MGGGGGGVCEGWDGEDKAGVINTMKVVVRRE